MTAAGPSRDERPAAEAAPQELRWRDTPSHLVALARIALRTPVELAAVGLTAERHVRRAVVRSASSTALETLDRTLRSPLAGEAVDRVVASEVAERAVSTTLEGPLVEAVARDLVRYGVVERIAEVLLAGGIADDIATRLVEGPELERIVLAALESPAAGRLAERIAQDEATERIVGRVIDGPLLDEVVGRLERSEELWVLVERIARSPAVTDAIGQQGIGFADQMAGVVRERSTTADERLEGVARRLLRRGPRGATDAARGAGPER